MEGEIIEKCYLCGEIPINALLYQCPLEHKYCIDCYSDLKSRYRGSIKNGATCLICRKSGVFTENFSNAVFGRSSIQMMRKSTEPKKDLKKKVTIENLFQLPTEKLKLLFKSSNDEVRIENPSSHSMISTQSKVPIYCPINSCNKIVGVSTFITHFKHEHSETPKYTAERGKELCLICDFSILVCKKNCCLAMINVHESNKIDVRNSHSSYSVIKTCNIFSQQVLLETFWLMVKNEKAGTFFWLFCSTEEKYRTTLELCSKYNSISFSTHCKVYSFCQKITFQDITERLNGLLICRNSFVALLQEGPELNLRITIQ